MVPGAWFLVVGGLICAKERMRERAGERSSFAEALADGERERFFGGRGWDTEYTLGWAAKRHKNFKRTNGWMALRRWAAGRNQDPIRDSGISGGVGLGG